MGLTASAVLLIFSLLNSIDLAADSARAAELEEQRKQLMEENRYLEAELQSRFSLENIESYAESRLGMKHCSPEQIEYIEYRDQG